MSAKAPATCYIVTGKAIKGASEPHCVSINNWAACRKELYLLCIILCDLTGRKEKGHERRAG